MCDFDWMILIKTNLSILSKTYLNLSCNIHAMGALQMNNKFETTRNQETGKYNR